MKTKKYVLVRFDYKVGDKELGSHVVIEIKNNDVKKTIHNFFMHFYGIENLETCEEGYMYIYNYVDIAVEINSYQELINDEYEGLKKLGLLY